MDLFSGTGCIREFSPEIIKALDGIAAPEEKP
jgi:hypothetical protein